MPSHAASKKAIDIISLYLGHASLFKASSLACMHAYHQLLGTFSLQRDTLLHIGACHCQRLSIVAKRIAIAGLLYLQGVLVLEPPKMGSGVAIVDSGSHLANSECGIMLIPHKHPFLTLYE